jgi:hypothetical protein
MQLLVNIARFSLAAHDVAVVEGAAQMQDMLLCEPGNSPWQLPFPMAAAMQENLEYTLLGAQGLGLYYICWCPLL